MICVHIYVSSIHGLQAFPPAGNMNTSLVGSTRFGGVVLGGELWSDSPWRWCSYPAGDPIL